MEKLKKFVESTGFQNFILVLIIINSIVIGLQTSDTIVEACGTMLSIMDYICLGIFVIELILKFIVYRFKFFTNGWNIFDLLIVILSFLSGLTFLASFRVFRVFRVFKSLKALKGLRALRLVSGLDNLRCIVIAIGKSLPGICWSGVLLLLIYYIFSIIGVSLFGADFPEWFGSIGKSLYTLFQVMTLESWSMGISRPVMETFSWAWCYFVPFVIISSFIFMNVVVGIVVNAISEVSAIKGKDTEEDKDNKELPDDKELIKTEISTIKEHLASLEALLEKTEKQ